MGDELRSQSWIFDTFILVSSIENSRLFKSLEQKLGLSWELSEFLDKILFRIFRHFVTKNSSKWQEIQISKRYIF